MDNENNKTEEPQYNLSLKQLARLTNTDAQELQSELTKTDPDTGESLDQDAKFEVISSFMSNHFNQVSTHKKGQGAREAMIMAKKTLAGKYGLDNYKNAKIEDMVDQIVSLSSDSESKVFTPQEAFKVKEVQDKISVLQKALEQKEKEIYDVKTGFEKNKTFDDVISKMIGHLDSEGAKFSSNPDIKNRQIQSFANNIRSMYDFDKNGDSLVILNKEGIPVENSNHMPISLKDLAMKNSLVDFESKLKPKATFRPESVDGATSTKFTKEQLERASHEYLRLMGRGKVTEANELKKAAEEYKQQNKTN